MYNQLLEEYERYKDKIEKRLEEFRNLAREEYFYEYLFCLLTPQSNAQKCWLAVEEIRKLNKIDREKLREILRTKTRFHNNKSLYIIEAINNWNIVEKYLGEQKDIVKLRSWLAENVKGYGLKEASHFLRNIGKSENKIAILDRHILKSLRAFEVIGDEKVKNKSDYYEIEQKFIFFASDIDIPMDHLDLFFWSRENGEVFK